MGGTPKKSTIGGTHGVGCGTYRRNTETEFDDHWTKRLQPTIPRKTQQILRMLFRRQPTPHLRQYKCRKSPKVALLRSQLSPCPQQHMVTVSRPASAQRS